MYIYIRIYIESELELKKISLGIDICDTSHLYLRHDIFVLMTRSHHLCDMVHSPGHETQKMPNEELWQDKLVYDAEINAFVFDPRGKRKKDVCLNETDVFPHIRHIHTMRSLCLIKKAICI